MSKYDKWLCELCNGNLGLDEQCENGCDVDVDWTDDMSDEDMADEFEWSASEKSPAPLNGSYTWGPHSTGGATAATSSTKAYSPMGTTSAYTPYVAPARHEHDGKLVFSVGRVRIGGGSSSGRYAKDADVIVDCAAGKWGHKEGGQKVIWGGDFTVLNDYLAPVQEVIQVAWSDGGSPPVPLSFFEDVVEVCRLRSERENRDISLVFACMGGHGRTGTALAAVLIALKGLSAAEAVKTVRKDHCKKACETESQLRWLCRAAGGNEDVGDPGFPLHSYASAYGKVETKPKVETKAKAKPKTKAKAKAKPKTKTKPKTAYAKAKAKAKAVCIPGSWSIK